MPYSADICSLDATSAGLQDSAVAGKQRQRRKVVASALGGWLQYLRKLTPYTQDGAAEHVGITPEGIKRVERGENVGIEFLLPYLSWLEEELGATQPKRYQELKDGLFERLVETGAAMRRAEPKGEKKPQSLPRAAVGEPRHIRGRAHRAR